MSWTSRAGTRPRTRAGGFMRGRHAMRSEALLLALALGSTQCAGCAARPPVRHRIVINRFQYQPPVLEISAGDTVEWVNQDIVPHTATAVSRSWDSKSISTGDSWR